MSNLSPKYYGNVYAIVFISFFFITFSASVPSFASPRTGMPVFGATSRYTNGIRGSRLFTLPLRPPRAPTYQLHSPCTEARRVMVWFEQPAPSSFSVQRECGGSYITKVLWGAYALMRCIGAAQLRQRLIWTVCFSCFLMNTWVCILCDVSCACMHVRTCACVCVLACVHSRARAHALRASMRVCVCVQVFYLWVWGVGVWVLCGCAVWALTIYIFCFRTISLCLSWAAPMHRIKAYAPHNTSSDITVAALSLNWEWEGSWLFKPTQHFARLYAVFFKLYLFWATPLGGVSPFSKLSLPYESNYSLFYLAPRACSLMVFIPERNPSIENSQRLKVYQIIVHENLWHRGSAMWCERRRRRCHHLPLNGYCMCQISHPTGLSRPRFSSSIPLRLLATFQLWIPIWKNYEHCFPRFHQWRSRRCFKRKACLKTKLPTNWLVIYSLMFYQHR